MDSKKRSFSAAPVALGLVLILAFGLRLYHLGSRPLYGDESYHTVMVATQSLSSITTTNLGSTLYALLAHFLLPLGQPEIMARLPAALFGFLSVWGIFLLGKTFFGKSEALLAALLLAVSVNAIYFSQQARGYSGLLFFSILSLYFFWRSINENQTALWILYILSTSVGIYTHIFLLIIVPVHALFVALLFLAQRLRKSPTEVLITKGTLWRTALSFLSIFILTVLLYLPMRTTETLNFFHFFKTSLTGVFKARLSLNFGSLFAEIIKKALSYNVLSWLFYLQPGLMLWGAASALKNHGRALILFFLYLSLPFLLFSLSDPSAVYLIPSPAKFIFILPLLFLLMAKGLTGLHSLLIGGISKLTQAGKSIALRNWLWVPLVLGIVVYEGVVLRDHYVYNWNLLSLPRDQETNAYIRQAVSQTEILYSDATLNKSTFLILQPLDYPDGRKKGVAVFESDYDYIFSTHLHRPTGFLAILNRSLFTGEDISRLSSLSSAAETKMLSRYIIVHFPSGNRTLYDNFTSLLNFLISCPGTGKNTFESHLILAKIHLLADRYPEALRELDTLRTLRSQPPPGTGPTQLTGRPSEVIQTLGRSSRDSLRVHVQDILAKSIQELLEKKADQSLLDGKFDVAIALQKEAERLHHNPLRSAVWRHLSLAEASLEKGMAREAASEYKSSLLLCRTLPYEPYVLKKILDIENLPFGYLIWRNEGVWEIRWWSRMKRTFSGTVESSCPFRSLGVFRLAFGENCRYSRKRAVFQGIVEGDKMQGLTLSVKSRSRLTFRLEIKGQREIKDHVTVLPEDTHPREMPFSLEER